MFKFVIIRHGLSVWSDRFTGWTDIDIAPSGIEETRKYGLKLKELGYSFDLGFTSYLKRGIKTMEIVLEVMGLSNIPVIKAWQLNERHYGALQGLNKPETVAKYGEKQVTIWRRSYDIPPPQLEKADPRHPANDPVYKDIDPSLLPASECLKDTYARSVPYFQKMIEPEIKNGKKVILSGHHNSLRAIIKYLDNISNEDIVSLNIPYCIPLVYELDENLKPIKHYYLAPDEEVKRVIEGIKNQT
ncbi:MAG: 2,3-diphosphoglycerate-dependent phosphoglycerate mutase, partial [Candidatus Roizmanbacteria bacterium]|nr:2,3-diphosphoglycerate-dependent phosphoglycerate mutase [Candidatus Roizmanbacteria bacterium]